MTDGETQWRQLGTVPVEPPDDPGVAAVVIPPRDCFADPPGLVVRDDVLAAVGGQEPVRAGALRANGAPTVAGGRAG